MDYETYHNEYGLREQSDFPLSGVNEDSEFMIIRRGCDDNGNFYQSSTFQSNGWERINTYYEDGTYCESYKKSNK